GALSLVRVNPIFIAPVVLLIILIKFWKVPKLLGKQLVFFIIGFALVFSPWLFTGVNAEGESWFLIKIRNVIDTRYQPQSSITPSRDQAPEYASISPDYLVTQNRKNLYSLTQGPAMGSDLPTEDIASGLPWVMFNHFLHNISGSLLIMPDSIAIYTLSDISAREYWQDNNQWDGNFPPGQYGLILINLLLLSLGIAFAWKKYHWAGLSPLIVFMAYNLSLAAATNSGSRYLVPISWIIFIYYALGLILTGKFLLHFLGIKTSFELSAKINDKEQEAKNSFKSWLPSIITLVIMALVLPFANLVLPGLINSETNAVQSANDPNPIVIGEYQILNGTILYPYYQEDGMISFDYLQGSRITSHQLSQSKVVSPDEFFLESGTPAILVVTNENNNFVVQSIFVQGDSSPLLIWQKQ
ncbi:MAG: hypothetical protein WBI14_04620, partial [Anaerolineaceae bacterium]